jgi:hypothetical protein
MTPGVIFFLFVVLAICGTVFKVAMARDMARRSGMDPDDAAMITLFDDDGLSATYLASNLRTPPPSQPSPAGPAGPSGSVRPKQPTAHAVAAGRIQQLKGLLDDGVITQVEYDERRKAIIDSI